MSLSTIKLTKGAPATVAQVQGAFVFYKKSTSATSDVNVFADNSLIATMSPTDSFSVNKTFNQLRFEPVDVNNEALFITAESAEDYKTSSVAGSVSIVGVPTVNVGTGSINIAQDFPEFLTRANVAYTASCLQNLAAGTTSSSSFIGVESGNAIYIDAIHCAVKDLTTQQNMASAVFFQFGTYTVGSATAYTYAWKKLDHTIYTPVLTAVGAGLSPVTNQGFSGLNMLPGSIKFAHPFRLNPGQFMGVYVDHAAGANAKNCTVGWEFHS